MCPFMSQQGGDRMVTQDGFVNCQGMSCQLWDEERECCSFNTKRLVLVTHKNLTEDRIKDRFKVEVLRLLEQKTGWGRIELKTALFDLIDGLEDEPSL